MRRRLEGFARGLRAVRPSERRAFVRAWGELLLARIGLKLGPFRRRLLTTISTHRASPSPPDPSLLRIFSVALESQPTPPLCLPRAVALSRFLAARGVTTRLRLGVRRDASAPLQGHAWIEWEDGPLAESEAFVRSFVPLTWPSSQD
jgi:hypothetical protein